MSDSRPGPPPANADECPAQQGEALSVRDAARIKGISYSAALRAIRAGRLPSRRVGRTLLISPLDLARWEPGRPDAGAAVGTAATIRPTVREAAMLSRMAWLSDVMADDREGEGAVLTAVCDRLVADFGLATAAVWTRGRSGQHLAPLVSSGPVAVAGDRTISLREAGATLSMLRPGLQDLEDTMPFPAEALTGRWRMVAPIRTGRQLAGLVTIVSAIGQEPLGEDDRRWADLLVTVLTAGLVGRRRQALEKARTRQFQTVIDALPEAAAVTDESARILIANSAFRMRFGLQPESLEIGVDLAALLGQVEHLHDVAGKRSVVPRLRAALADGEATTLPLTLAPAVDRGTDRLVITPVDAAGDAGEQQGASLIRIVPPPARTGVPPGAPKPVDQTSRPDDPATELVELDRIAGFISALGAADRLNDVLIAGVDELRDIFGASAGSVLLRRDDGMLVRLWPTGFVETARLRTVVDPTETGAVRLAIEQRTATLLRRSTADRLATAALDRAGSDGGLIIPLLVGEKVIGLAVLAFFAEPPDFTGEQLALATSLGRYLASAITNARNWDRWGVAQRHLLTVIDQLPQGVVVVDAVDGSLLVANRAADALWGREVHGSADTDDVSALGDAVRDQTVTPLTTGHLTVHDADGEPFPDDEAPMARTLRLGERRLAEPLTLVRGDGTTVRVIGNHVPILADDGRILSAVGVFQDTEQLREVDRAKDEFLSVVAHELRNPLTSLRGNMQLLQRRLRRESDAARTDDLMRLDGLIAQADRINELVGRLLDVSRADLDRITLAWDRCDGVELVVRALETARGLAAGQVVVTELPAELPVTWDRVRIGQVLDNLLSNAIRYAGTGEIRVTLRPVEAGQVEITVRDRGPGMPDAVKARVFERYYRATPGARGSDGLGIGLYISSRIVSAHRGTIAVADAPGGGSVFTVRLPLDASEAAVRP